MTPITPSPTKRGRKPAWPKIRIITERSGRKSYRVDAGCWPGKTRNVKQFKTSAEADAHADALRDQRETQAKADRFDRLNRAVSLTALSDDERADVLAAFKELLGTKGTLVDAVQFWKKHAAPAQPVSVEALLEQYLESLRIANRRPRTLRDARGKVSAFTGDHPQAIVQSITAPDVDGWLSRTGKKKKWGPASRNAYRRALVGYFNFARQRNLIDNNPAEGVRAAEVDQGMPVTFTVREIRRLLGATRRTEPKLIPFVVLGIFCGLRPENELRGLDWRDVDLERKTVLVRPASAKKRRMRYVDLAENVLDFLRPLAAEEGLIYYSRRKMADIVALAKINWTRDVMRHTFASYHLAQHENAGATALQLGHHGDTTMLFSHYRNLVRREDAARFWSLRPLVPRVLRFPTAATAWGASHAT